MRCRSNVIKPPCRFGSSSQVTSTADAYLDPAAFDALPLVPQPHKAYPRVVFIVSFESGVLKECNKAMVEEIMSFKSFRDMEVRANKVTNERHEQRSDEALRLHVVSEIGGSQLVANTSFLRRSCSWSRGRW